MRHSEPGRDQVGTYPANGHEVRWLAFTGVRTAGVEAAAASALFPGVRARCLEHSASHVSVWCCTVTGYTHGILQGPGSRLNEARSTFPIELHSVHVFSLLP